MTILIPRYPNLGKKIKSLFDEIKFAQRSKNKKPEIHLVDSLGELGNFYQLADLSKRISDILSNQYRAESLTEAGSKMIINSENIAAKIIDKIT